MKIHPHFLHGYSEAFCLLKTGQGEVHSRLCRGFMMERVKGIEPSS